MPREPEQNKADCLPNAEYPFPFPKPATLRGQWDYYNDFDEGACDWLRALIRAGEIPPGEVDNRSILDVAANDLVGFRRVHFFAGIGGWAYALRLAGFPEGEPVWTGSPPCQPFSAAGKQLGRADERHLAPHFVGLVRACRPRLLFGEQVASAEVFGKAATGSGKRAAGPPQWAWLDDLSDRLEAARYAVGASDFPSAGVGAPHIRQRTFFGAVAHEWLEHATGDGRDERRAGADGRGASSGRGDGGLAESYGGQCDRIADGKECQHHWAPTGRQQGDGEPAPSSGLRWLADSIGAGLEGYRWHGDDRDEPGRVGEDATGPVAEGRADGGLDDACGIGRPTCRGGDHGRNDREQLAAAREGRGLGHPGSAASQRHPGSVPAPEAREHGAGIAVDGPMSVGPEHAGSGMGRGLPSPLHGFWRDADWLFCRDGKWRPVERSVLGLVDGLPGVVVPGGSIVPAAFPLAPKGHEGNRNRVMRLRGYGNAINPHAAAEFIRAFCDARVEVGA